MRRWKPSLEGSLAIFNVLSLLSFVFLMVSSDVARWVRPFETAIVVWLWILSLPISAFCFLIVAGSRTQDGSAIVLLCAVAGVNAIVWGRGVAWVLRRTLLARFAQAMDEDDQADHASDDDQPLG